MKDVVKNVLIAVLGSAAGGLYSFSKDGDLPALIGVPILTGIGTLVALFLTKMSFNKLGLHAFNGRQKQIKLDAVTFSAVHTALFVSVFLAVDCVFKGWLGTSGLPLYLSDFRRPELFFNFPTMRACTIFFLIILLPTVVGSKHRGTDPTHQIVLGVTVLVPFFLLLYMHVATFVLMFLMNAVGVAVYGLFHDLLQNRPYDYIDLFRSGAVLLSWYLVVFCVYILSYDEFGERLGVVQDGT